MRSSTGSRIARASSGSRSAISSIEPFKSANSTVTCLRSPSSAAREVRIFSARCFGVYSFAEAKRGCVAAAAGAGRGASCAPHSEQNFAEAALPWPHAGHARGSGAPHSEQNFAASGTLALQLGHFIGASRTTARRLQAPTVTRLAHAAFLQLADPGDMFRARDSLLIWPSTRENSKLPRWPAFHHVRPSLASQQADNHGHARLTYLVLAFGTVGSTAIAVSS